MARETGGGGGVSYPDPNVHNDDNCLQYDITYRGSGKQVIEVVLGMSVACVVIAMATSSRQHVTFVQVCPSLLKL